MYAISTNYSSFLLSVRFLLLFFFLFLSKVQLIHREDWLEFYRFKLFAVCYQFSSLCGRFSSPRKSASEKLKGILFSCAFFPSISKTIYPLSFIAYTLKLLLQFEI